MATELQWAATNSRPEFTRVLTLGDWTIKAEFDWNYDVVASATNWKNGTGQNFSSTREAKEWVESQISA